MWIPRLRQRTMLAAGAVAVSLATAAILFFSSQGQGQPDTTRSSAPRKPRSYGETWNPTIRVNLTPTTLAEVPFSVDGPCSIIVPGTNRVLSTPNHIDKTVAAVVNRCTGGRQKYFRAALLPADAP